MSDREKMAFVLMLGMATADGHIDSAERTLLAVAAAKLGIRPSEVEAVFENPRSHVEQALRAMPTDKVEQRSLIRVLATTMAADGKVDEREFAYLAALATAMSITPDELRLMLA